MKSWKLQRACANSSWHRLPQGLTRTRSNCKGFAGAEKWSHLRHFTEGHSQLGSVKGLKHPSRPISTGRHTHAPVHGRRAQAHISGEAYTCPLYMQVEAITSPYPGVGARRPISVGRHTQAHVYGGRIRAHIYVEANAGHIYGRHTQAHGKFCVVPRCRLTDLQSAIAQNVQLFLCLFLSCQVFRASPRDSPRDSPRESPQDSPQDSP